MAPSSWVCRAARHGRLLWCAFERCAVSRMRLACRGRWPRYGGGDRGGEPGLVCLPAGQMSWITVEERPEQVVRIRSITSKFAALGATSDLHSVARFSPPTCIQIHEYIHSCKFNSVSILTRAILAQASLVLKRYGTTALFARRVRTARSRSYGAPLRRALPAPRGRLAAPRDCLICCVGSSSSASWRVPRTLRRRCSQPSIS